MTRPNQYYAQIRGAGLSSSLPRPAVVRKSVSAVAVVMGIVVLMIMVILLSIRSYYEAMVATGSIMVGIGVSAGLLYLLRAYVGMELAHTREMEELRRRQDEEQRSSLRQQRIEELASSPEPVHTSSWPSRGVPHPPPSYQVVASGPTTVSVTINHAPETAAGSESDSDNAT